MAVIAGYKEVYIFYPLGVDTLTYLESFLNKLLSFPRNTLLKMFILKDKHSESFMTCDSKNKTGFLSLCNKLINLFN